MISNEEMEHIISISPAVFFSVKNENQFPINYITRNICLYGYSPEDFYSGNISIKQLVHPEDYQRIKNDYKNKIACTNSTGFTQTYRIRKQDGEYSWIDVHNWIRWNKTQKKIDFFEGLFINVDERISSHAALKLSEKKFKEINNSLMDGFAEVDMEGNIRYCNPAFAEMLGYKREEIINLSYFAFTPTAWHAKEKSIIHDQVLTRGYSDLYEKEYIKKNGVIFPVEIRAYLFKNSNHEPDGMWAIVRDITERKRSIFQRDMLISELEKSVAGEVNARVELEKKQEELTKALVLAEESNRLKNEFLTIISHELRTPLHGILGYAQILVDDKSLTPEQQEQIDYILQSGDRLMNVLNELLEISLIETQKGVVETQAFTIQTMLDDIYILLKNKFLEKNICFHYDLHGIEEIESDPARIRQILLHLIGNAVKFSEKGEVKVELSLTDNRYLFKIIDTGIGISEENKSNIFELFTQIESSINRTHEGVGLGLPICKKLVHSLSGKIWFESKLGEGTTFFCAFPQKIP